MPHYLISVYVCKCSLPCVSRETGSENSPATALLHAFTLKVM